MTPYYINSYYFNPSYNNSNISDAIFKSCASKNQFQKNLESLYIPEFISQQMTCY